jgi:hypothetical protein
MSLKTGVKMTPIDMDEFKTWLESKNYADSTVRYEVRRAKRVIRDGLTEENMFDKCPIETRNVRHDVRRAIRRLKEFEDWCKNG